MLLALNYSHTAADLRRAGEVQIDLFKCPAWPDLIATALEVRPTYVHFPLVVGSGIGDAIDSETKQRADWRNVETLLVQTNTPLVNLHLAPRPQDYPDLPSDTTEAAHIERITANLLRDVQSVVARFGASNVIVENNHLSAGTILRAACLPHVTERIVNGTGCGFLFDLSHARLAASDLGVDARDRRARRRYRGRGAVWDPDRPAAVRSGAERRLGALLRRRPQLGSPALVRRVCSQRQVSSRPDCRGRYRGNQHYDVGSLAARGLAGAYRAW